MEKIVKDIIKQMEKDLPKRKTYIDLTTAYGYYLGIFQVHHFYDAISNKEAEDVTNKLLKLFFECKKKWDKND